MPSNGKQGDSGDTSTGNGRMSYHSLGINFSIPVYTTVKGVSQICIDDFLLLLEEMLIPRLLITFSWTKE